MGVMEVRDSRRNHDAGAVPAPYEWAGDPESPVVATAIHAGHDVRPEVADLVALGDAERMREEDPCTDRIATMSGFSCVVARSRFEVDLNRPREAAVYRTSEDSWGLTVWRSEPPPDLIGRSLQVYDDFYRDLGTHLDRLAASGPFVVLDLHSYNHRRNGPRAASAPLLLNPDLNLGTGTLGGRWRFVVEALTEGLSRTEVRGGLLDVRENVRFTGGNLSRWVNERYATTGCAVAVEFKKTFMDEWTGAIDLEHLEALTRTFHSAVPHVLDALKAAS